MYMLYALTEPYSVTCFFAVRHLLQGEKGLLPKRSRFNGSGRPYYCFFQAL